MDDWGIFGLSVGTVANLAVAGATLVLVIYTYKSVKASEDQVTMNQKEKERPIILEFINTRLNPIQEDLSHDLQVIQNNEIDWNPEYPIRYHDYGTLVFPVSDRKDFHTRFSQSSFPFFLYSNKTFKNHARLMNEKLKWRRGTYAMIDQKLGLIHKELSDAVFDEFVKSGFSTGPEITDYFSVDSEPATETGEEIFSISRGPRKTPGISRQALIEEIKQLIVVALFQSKDSRDFRESKKNFIFPIPEAIERINSLINRLNNPEIFHLKREIENQIYDLKITDEIILESISDIKRILQERYLFTDKEMNQFFLM